VNEGSKVNIDGLPNLIIAGVGKAGTTSLFTYLGQHRQICASNVKELEYFSPLRHRGGTLASIDTYARYFRHCCSQPYRLEASPNYCYGGEPIIVAIKSILKCPKIIIILRDPVDRLWSAYAFLKSRGRLPKGQTCDEFISECETTAKGSNDDLDVRHTPLSVGIYANYLMRWMDAFGDDLKVVFAEDLFSAPEVVVGNLCTWLRIDQEPVREIDYSVKNKTAHPRSYTFAKIAWRVRPFAAHLLQKQPRVRSIIRRAYGKVNTQPVKERLQPVTRRRLELIYRDSNQWIASELRCRGYRALPSWLSAAAPSSSEWHR
jgi:hypothetical protein